MKFFNVFLDSISDYIKTEGGIVPNNLSIRKALRRLRCPKSTENLTEALPSCVIV